MIRRWSKEEEILALYAYCHVPFNKASNSHPWIVRVANLIDRTPASVKMKIGNFGAFDPHLRASGIVGLTSTSKLDAEVWQEYYDHWDKLTYDAENLLQQLESQTYDNIIDLPLGEESLTFVKRRLNQSFFRSIVLSSYNNTCCITGINHPNLLDAAHIIAWCDDESLRTNPTNGLCFTPTFHHAYDCFLISITPDYKIAISDLMIDSATQNPYKKYLKEKNNTQIYLPHRFIPNPDLLDLHYQKYLINN